MFYVRAETECWESQLTLDALLSIPAGESNTPRLAIESAVDDNDFTITGGIEDGNGTYTMLGQNVKLNSSGDNHNFRFCS